MNFYNMLAIVFFVSFSVLFAELSEDEMKRFRDVEIAGTREDTWKNDDREEYEVLEVNTFQNSDDPMDYDMTRFRIRLVVELTDKEKNKYVVNFTGSPSNNYYSEYEGEDYWKLYMKHGDLERLKISGFAVQYGIMDGETFVLLAEEEDDYEDILAGLKARTTRIFPNQVYLRHYYMYNDAIGGSTESVPRNVRLIQE